MCVTHTPAPSENIWNLLQTFTVKNHHFSLLRSVPLLLLLYASPRLSSSRIRAGRSCKCAAGGRSSIKLSAGEKISWCGEKQLGTKRNGACRTSWCRDVTGPFHLHSSTPNTIAFPSDPPNPKPTQTERERQSHLSLDPAQLAWCQSESSPGSACSDCRTSWCGPEKTDEWEVWHQTKTNNTLLTHVRDLAHQR